ncbi:hypothetical protein [Burkholderia pseudomallei]|uniref:hypothetical protein n=1 Tax=Burkholderia pseudomallei TaxID=28450 RepID=UPI0005368EB9|nr:hypothetical protein Y042_5937 [Burkholderia pseudomallei MSHR1357]MBF3539865.1 hypothetical protein [Burkholderia pseudomallei]MBF3910379.1 hypothetical protein [Burkholderia pseudomallei]
MAATNRWLTAADACVARCPTKLAFCSRFRRQRKSPIVEGWAVFFGFCGGSSDLFKECQNTAPTKHKKAGGEKPPAFAQRA